MSIPRRTLDPLSGEKRPGFLPLGFFASAVPAIVLTAMLLVGCAREPEIKNPHAVTVGFLADAKRLLPLLASDSASGEIAGWIFNGLTKYDKDIRITGDLAESWDVTPDGLRIVFHLRRGVLWHDGVEFTSDDVLFTYNTVIDPKVPTPFSSNFGPVRKVEALDRYTVSVSYDEPFAPALESWGMGILPKHILENKDITTEYYSRNPIGTGPYRLREWVTGQKIVLDANESYFEGNPGIEKYIAQVIQDTATMFLELKFGGIDYMGLTPPQYKLQADKEDFTKYFNKFRYPSFGYTYLGFNLLHPPFSDVRVRRAIAHAIDKREIIAGVLLGYGTPCTGPFPRTTPRSKTSPSIPPSLSDSSGMPAGKWAPAVSSRKTGFPSNSPSSRTRGMKPA